MYLYGKAIIDEQPIKFAAFVTGVSIGACNKILYTLVPTKVFTKSDIINLLSLESDLNNVDGRVNFENETEGFFDDVNCEFFTDSVEFIDLLKMK